MCDSCCQSCWSKNFYKQYLGQHSAMMQWLHQGYPSYGGEIPVAHPAVTYHCDSCMNNDANQLHRYQEPVQEFDYSGSIPNNENQRKRNRELLGSSSESSSGESDVSRDDIIGSDDEIYFDPGCFLKFAEDKESLSEKSDSDEEKEKEEFEIVDSVIEEFEYVQLDKFGNMTENRKGRIGHPHSEKEMKIEKEIKEYLYGDKADTIAGLETAMSLDFYRHCDLLQPHLWPVLPVRLSKA